MEDKERSLETMRHTTAHILAQAVKRLYPNATPTIGPVIENGFYYDFDNLSIKEEDLPKIEEEMKSIIKENIKIERIEYKSKEEAKKDFKDNPYKIELIDDAKGELSAYRQGDFLDLCRGPHLSSTGQAGAFKLTSIASAYWRGDEKNKMLTRIYGLAFPTKDELKSFIKLREEASARDHRKIGKEQELFMISSLVGAGLPIWMPNGTIIREELMNFLKKEQKERDYLPVITPHIGKIDLFKVSGHWQTYRESMYSPMKVEDEEYILKPMNCPFHIQVYSSKRRSYKELPLRLAEFGTVYRYELSGELTGLARVRGFTQDDAHIFCTPEQVKSEIKGVLDLVMLVFNTLGFKNFRIRIGTRGDSDKYIGDESVWKRAEADIKSVAEESGLGFSIEEGDAAFYGPKIDFLVKDVLGREWQLGTVQLDYNLPERFNLEFIDSEDNAKRPVMIHRAPFGSLERFMGILIEHFGGRFPTWLSPVQAIIIPISDKHLDYCKSIKDKLALEDIRCEVDERSEKTGKKIRDAEIKKTPYILVAGDKEVADNTLNVRLPYLKKVIGERDSDAVIKAIKDDISKRKIIPEEF